MLLGDAPAIAALVGAAVLSQGLGLRDVVAIAFVVAARHRGAGRSRARARDGTMTACAAAYAVAVDPQLLAGSVGTVAGAYVLL